MEKEELTLVSENEVVFRGERYTKTGNDSGCSECDLKGVCGKIDWVDKDGIYVSCFNTAWKKAKKKQPRQIIKCFKNNEDFYKDKPLDLVMPVNHNLSNRDNFTKHVLCGIVWGLTARYSTPVAAAYDVDEDGKEKLIRTMNACRVQRSKLPYDVLETIR